MDGPTFYNMLASTLRAELTNTNLRVRVADRLADVFEQADTPETFDRITWINLVRNG